MLGVYSDQTGTILTSQVIDCQVHTIRKVIRSLFTDSVAY